MHANFRVNPTAGGGLFTAPGPCWLVEPMACALMPPAAGYAERWAHE